MEWFWGGGLKPAGISSLYFACTVSRWFLTLEYGGGGGGTGGADSEGGCYVGVNISSVLTIIVL